MKLIFFGTSEFAVPILQAIRNMPDWNILLVVSEPAKPQGRRQEIIDTPVARYSKETGLNLATPDDLSKVNWAEYKADVAVVVSYGRILSKEIISLPVFGMVNIHPSLLPKLRGASPIQSVLAQGLSETGVTLMVIDEKMDHGPILSQEVFSVGADDTYLTLEPKLAELGAKIIIRDLPKYVLGEIKPREQNHSQATFTKLIKKENGLIDWSKPAEDIYNQWRAYLKWPGVYTFFKNKFVKQTRLKLIKIEKCPTPRVGHKPGEVFIDESKNLCVACHTGAIKIIKLQPEGSKILTAQEFLNGYGYVLNSQLFRQD